MALFCTSLICVIYSGSRTAYVALIAFSLFWWAISPNRRRNLLIGCILGVVAISVMPPQYRERLVSITGEEEEGHSKETRIKILEDAWVILMENPAGVGIASFPAVRLNRFGRRQDTHNL